jgi:hypothetical protein
MVKISLSYLLYFGKTIEQHQSILTTQHEPLPGGDNVRFFTFS